MKLFKKKNYYNCRCRPVNKVAEKEMLKKLKEWGYCPVCAGVKVDTTKYKVSSIKEAK